MHHPQQALNNKCVRVCVWALSQDFRSLFSTLSWMLFGSARSNLNEMGRKSLIRMPDDEKFMAWHRTHPALAPE